MTRYAYNFVPRYKTCIETRHENRDSLSQSERGWAGYLLTRPRTNKSGNLSQNTPVWDMVYVLRNMYFTKRPSFRYNFRPCLVKIGLKLLELESGQLAKCLNCAKWPCDLVFDSVWPIFELDLDIIQIQLQTRFGEDWIKTIWIRVWTTCWMFKMH